MTNCPNCGAVLSCEGGLHCDYCGSVFERPEPNCEEVVFYSDGVPYYSTTRGLLIVNEMREMLRPRSASTHETR